MNDEHREKCHKNHCENNGKDYLYDLCRYRKNIYSQNGEDGAIGRLLEILGIKTGWCCEFGAWDGKHLSNTFYLIKQGWKGVFIENDSERYTGLKETQKQYPENIIIFQDTIHFMPQKGVLLDDVLSRTPIPKNFELLSIDVDGPDYQIWLSLKDYQPQIVIVECSGISGWHIHREGAKNGDSDITTSFGPLKELGESKGYKLVAEMGNLIFVHKDILMPYLINIGYGILTIVNTIISKTGLQEKLVLT